jgi:hypothetical protein
MTWDAIKSSIVFWSQANQWNVYNLVPPLALNVQEENDILTSLKQLYDGSATARAILEAGTKNGKLIRIGLDPDPRWLSTSQ